MARLYILSFLFGLLSCSSPQQKLVTHQGAALGTSYTIQYLPFGAEQAQVQKGIDSLFFLINASMSTYIPTSTISMINKGDSLVVIDDHFEKVFLLSEQVWKITEGYFDPTVGSMVNAYGFGPEIISGSITKSKRDSLMKIIGWDRLSLTSDRRIIKDASQVYIDFNAIAKGYTVDVISDFLVKQGSESHLVEIGGEIRVQGQNPISKKPWRIGIDRPISGTRGIQSVAQLTNASMATSGNYRKFRIDSLTGEKFVHSISPLTGLPVRSSILSVSIKASTCALADAYATALMVMPFEQGQKLIEADRQLEAYWILSGKGGEYQEVFSSNWE